MSNEPTQKQGGLHCVYGQCRGIPYSDQPCNPGCSFTWTPTPETYYLTPTEQRIMHRALRRSLRPPSGSET